MAEAAGPMRSLPSSASFPGNVDRPTGKFGSNHHHFGLPSCTSVVCACSCCSSFRSFSSHIFYRTVSSYPPCLPLLLLLSSLYHVSAGNRRLSLSSCMYLYACIIRITVCSSSGHVRSERKIYHSCMHSSKLGVESSAHRWCPSLWTLCHCGHWCVVYRRRRRQRGQGYEL
ncbi:hypothetical protein L227DRAFT_151737 [Lentinus tigrinus ALCF2SS1-6]|uniref:Uncharacterized protein n=1 Tax=Lentinus tigrinus ALCF2SS1-6 TaxID=1328759 RepID=A0A5C2S8Q4_9APHY|nr:hypothetical protein L227DRAFT_151737 [Lentinus tigrinus ALCF2SS1-6]